MTKAEFLKELKKKLRMLPANEKQRVLDYYNEMIEDEMEEGLSEEAAVMKRGSVAEIAEQTMREYIREHSQGDDSSKEGAEQNGGLLKRLVITAVSFPFWLPLYAAGWSILIAFFATSLSCALAGIVYIIPSAMLAASKSAEGYFQLGMFLASLGCGAALGIGSWELTKLWLKLSGWLLKGIRYSFNKESVKI